MKWKSEEKCIPLNIILNAIRAKTPPNKPQSIIDKNNQAEAMLIAIKMLNNRNIVEIDNVEMSINFSSRNIWVPKDRLYCS